MGFRILHTLRAKLHYRARSMHRSTDPFRLTATRRSFQKVRRRRTFWNDRRGARVRPTTRSPAEIVENLALKTGLLRGVSNSALSTMQFTFFNNLLRVAVKRLELQGAL